MMRPVVLGGLLLVGLVAGAGSIWHWGLPQGLPPSVARLIMDPDEADWREAERADTADGFIRYLREHPDGKFAVQARKAARRFLTVKYSESADSDIVTITSGFGDMVPYPTAGNTRVPGIEHIRKEWTEYTFSSLDFQFRFGNAVLQPRLTPAVYLYRDHTKGIGLFGFEIRLSGASESVPVYEFFRNPIVNAVSQNDLQRVKALIARRVDINAANDSFTALMLASQNGQVDMVRALLDAKADVNGKPSGGPTPLMLAAMKGNENIVRALLSAKADVNAKAGDGTTALMLAATGGHAAIVSALLGASADVNAKGGPGFTALKLASQGHHEDVMQLLRRAGAVDH